MRAGADGVLHAEWDAVRVVVESFATLGIPEYSESEGLRLFRLRK